MLELQNFEDIAVINLEGELGPNEMGVVSETLLSLLKKQKKKVVLNFREVEHVHYLSISSLVKKIFDLKNYQGDLKFAEMNDYTKSIFRFVGAEDFVENFDSVSEAVLSFRSDWRTWH